MKHLVRREFHHTEIKDGEPVDYYVLRIYNNADNSILAEGEPNINHHDTKVTYDELEYWNIPDKGEYVTLITLESLINKFKKNE